MFISTVVNIFNYEMLISTAARRYLFNYSGYIFNYECSFQQWLIYSTMKCSFQLRLDKSNLTSNLLLPLRRYYSGSDVLTHVMSDRLERQTTALTFEYDLAAHDLFKDDVTDVRCHVIVWREYCRLWRC